MEIKKIAIRILLILIPILCILLPTKVSAMTSKEAGEYIGNYAINFDNSSKADLVMYDKYYSVENPADWEKRAHIVNTGTVWPATGRYDLECVGFVSMVIKQSIGLMSDDGSVERGSSGYMAPGYAPDSQFEVVTNLQKGDILANSHHVMVYVGGGMIVHCSGHGPKRIWRVTI